MKTEIRSKLKIYIKPFFLIIILFLLNSTNYSQNGLTNYISIEDAIRIARQSIQRASGIRIKHENFIDKTYGQILKSKYVKRCLCLKLQDIFKEKSKEKINDDDIRLLEDELNGNCFLEKRLGLNDKLEFLGITDEFRLTALKRYIVRNSEIGVPSIWGYNSRNIAQPYIITNTQLKKLSTGSTVLETAMLIRESAGLPFLPLSTTELVVRDCRKIVTGKSDNLDTKNVVKTDIGSDQNLKDFRQCLEKHENLLNPLIKYGLESIQIKDGSGNTQSYRLLDTGKTRIEKLIEERKSYLDLIVELSASAIILPSVEFLSARFVVNSILNVLSPGLRADKSKAFRITDAFLYVTLRNKPDGVSSVSKLTNPCALNSKTEFSTIYDPDIVYANTKLSELSINPEDLKKELEKLSAKAVDFDFYYRGKKDEPMPLPRLLSADFSFDDQITVDSLIELITKKLNS